ncbi:hypothetical protein GF357_00905 [Candidatus Dojkabacteria bacterium]|nr:hypothetical protein [Candidatus Dojkabacteria bacterium]
MDYYLIASAGRAIVFIALDIVGIVLTGIFKNRIKNRALTFLYFILSGLSVIISFLTFLVPILLSFQFAYEGPGGLYPPEVVSGDPVDTSASAYISIVAIGSFIEFMLFTASKVTLLLALFRKPTFQMDEVSQDAE